VKRTIWLKRYQNGNHIGPSEQRLQEISITKIDLAQDSNLRPLDFRSNALFSVQSYALFKIFGQSIGPEIQNPKFRPKCDKCITYNSGVAKISQ